MREVVYHPRVPNEARELVEYYDGILTELGIRFWGELIAAIKHAQKHPEMHHFDYLGGGLRRSNLKKFPVHFLFRVFPEKIRITVVKHHKRRPTYGIRRK